MLEKLACPHCSHQIEISRVLYQKIAEDLEKKADLQKKHMEAEFAQKLQSQKIEAWKIAQVKAKEQSQKQFAELQASNLDLKNQFQAKLSAEAQLRKELRDQEQKSFQMKLDNQKELDRQKRELETQLKANLEGEKELLQMQIKNQYLKELELEKDKTRQEQQKTKQMEGDILSLKRKLEQGSMQLQGDASENTIKSWLGEWFPQDDIQDVPTGIKGADLIQTIINEQGLSAGKIVFESKNTKDWSAAWIGKLKHDQGLVSADIAILVSKALPKNVSNFIIIDGVFVVSFNHLKPLVCALRFHLENIYRLSNSLENRDEKIQFLYKYLSGPQFKNRMENIVFAFKSLKEGLDTEKRAMQRIWNKREKEIEKVIDNTAGLYGDMQGIIGGNLPRIELLELTE